MCYNGLIYQEIFLSLSVKLLKVPADLIVCRLQQNKCTMALIDEIDVKLLKALQKNAKASTKELCDLLHLTKTPVYERIHRLEKEGIIKGYSAVIDNSKVGLPLVVFCNVSLTAHDDEHIQCFKSDIAGIDEVTECYCTGGHYDFLLKVVLKDLEQYNTFVFERLTKVRGIARMQSSFIISEIKKTAELNITIGS